MRRKRFIFDLRQFWVIAKRVPDSYARHRAFTHTNANQQCHGNQSG